MWEDEREERSRGYVVVEQGCEGSDSNKEMYKRRTEANKARYKHMENRARKVVTKAMKEAAEPELRELSEHPNKVFKLVKSMKKDGKDVERGRYMRGSNERKQWEAEFQER